MEKFPTVFLVTRIPEASYPELIHTYIQKGYTVEKETRYECFEDGTVIIRVQMKVGNK